MEVDRVEARHAELQFKYSVLLEKIPTLPLIHVLGNGSFAATVECDHSKPLPTCL
jgi:hypothetical protein